VVAADGNSTHLEKLLEERVVWLAFQQRTGIRNTPGSAAKTEREEFERNFEIVTPDIVLARNPYGM
jgi:hypothetical protein